MNFVGDNPFFIVISPLPPDERGDIVIDLDTRWLTDHADLLRIPAMWQLVFKESGQTAIAMFVHDGDQPYYSRHHVGVTGGGTNEIEAYGIGKKRADGTTERMWLLPNGTFCTDDDVDTLGIMLVKQLGPR